MPVLRPDPSSRSRRSTSRAGVPHHRHGPLRAFARAASWHRRKLAVLAAVATVLTGLAAAAPPEVPGASVVRTRVAVPGGAVLTADDLEVVELAEDALPEGAAPDAAELVGRRVAAPLPRHQVVTHESLVAVSAVAPGRVLAPVRLADADVVALLRPGDRVDVLAVAGEGVTGQGGAATTVARGVRVVTVPAPDPDQQGVATGALVVLDLPDTAAESLTRAATGGSLTVVWT